MNGLMMEQPLLISTLLTHAERHHGEQEIVSRRVEGDVHRYTFRELAERSRRLANALAARGIPRRTVRGGAGIVRDRGMRRSRPAGRGFAARRSETAAQDSSSEGPRHGSTGRSG